MSTIVLVLVATGLLMSVVGSFAPVFVAEAYVVAVAVAQPVGVALAVAAAVVVGQTLGKLVVLVCARAAPPADGAGRRAWLDRLRARTERWRAARAGSGPARAGGWLRRHVASVDRWTVDAMARPRAPLVVAVSGAVGLPPLLVVTVYAGRSTMPTSWFAAACAAGRGARMLTLALVPGLAGGLAFL
ncbi:hypothetical protein KIN34_06165 [Cellulomonas sp. DKR-3]|uniref:VTT domain-containing protein n=1 Tax=Cellulomonas fulva TaxID=2835530 RepID=A0ABS5TXI4_9CELL|nr:hypothetical protein [Cellulomonas fulva]MBT0993870.1 hypothetical protein [Cellulomonas fulva]